MEVSLPIDELKQPLIERASLPIRTLNQIEQMIKTAKSVKEVVSMLKSTLAFVNQESLFLPIMCKQSVHFFVGEVKENPESRMAISAILGEFLEKARQADSIAVFQDEIMVRQQRESRICGNCVVL